MFSPCVPWMAIAALAVFLVGMIALSYYWSGDDE